MSKHLMTVAALLVGSGLTMICAGGGLTWLLMIVSGPPRTPPPPRNLKTVLIRLENTDVGGVAPLLREQMSEHGQIGVNRSERLVRITDVPEKVDHLKHIAYELDEPVMLPVGPPTGCLDP
jgi:type II secretory pathway component GspD/PulD (secretin)